MSAKQQTPNNPKVEGRDPRIRNEARSAVLSGRHILKNYTSPLDTQHLMSKEEFRNKFIRNKPGNLYTGSQDVVEVREEACVPSPISPITPASQTTAVSTQRSVTATSRTSYDDEPAPTGWYSLNL